MDDPWKEIAVAQAQRDLVEYQLNESFDGRVPPVFDEYRKALQELLDRRRRQNEDGVPLTILDAGCGCGHYGIFTSRFFPEVMWTGADSSQAMVDTAIYLLEKYDVTRNVGHLPVQECSVDLYECVLLSQVLEMTDNPPEVLERILSQAMRYVILHRLRITGEEKSGRVYEPTYLALESQNWLWNGVAILSLLRKYGHVIYSHHIPGMTTLVWEKER